MRITQGGLLLLLLLAGCGAQPITPSGAHIGAPLSPEGAIPPPVRQTAVLSPPKPSVKAETYSVVVNNVPARELLFALARDAKLNIDISPGIEGNVTLNALDQTLPQLLARIAKQVDMRYEIDSPNLAVLPDTPYLKQYKVDYLNMARDSTSNVSIATQIATTGSGASGSATGGGGVAGNNSTTGVVGKSSNHFWNTLVQNIKDILRETDRLLPEGSSETSVEQTGTQSTTGSGAAASAGASRKTAAKATANTIAGSPNPATLSTENATVTRRSTFREAASVIVNAETGLIAVRATSRQHEKIQEFLDQVLASAKRQVLIEATVVEVNLSEQFQSGIDWKRIALGSGFTFRQNFNDTNLGNVATPSINQDVQSLISGVLGDTNFSLQQKSNIINQIAPGFGNITNVTDPGTGAVTQQITGIPGAQLPAADTAFQLAGKGMLAGYSNAASTVAGAIQLLDTFGNVKVLSSPKISVLNNQTALLKVVDNSVYFSITATTTATQNSTLTTYTSTLNTVPIGLVMSVTPQISDTGEITLNVRPTISRISGYTEDPNPALKSAPNGQPLTNPVKSLVPIIQTREMESMMRIDSGQIAVMGGLMEDSIDHAKNTVPGLGSIPLIGEAFTGRNETSKKTELVIFLRPVVIKEASLEGDYRHSGVRPPGADFLRAPSDYRPSAETRK
ncbi:MAG: type II secretion system protein GspD [Burkholderiales bacterium]